MGLGRAVRRAASHPHPGSFLREASPQHNETGATPSEDGSLDHPVQASRRCGISLQRNSFAGRLLLDLRALIGTAASTGSGDRVEPSAALEWNDRHGVVADNHPLRSRAACRYNGLLHGRNSAETANPSAGGSTLLLALGVALGMAAGATLGTYLGRPIADQLRRIPTRPSRWRRRVGARALRSRRASVSHP